jgi:hypothetical protein
LESDRRLGYVLLAALSLLLEVFSDEVEELFSDEVEELFSDEAEELVDSPDLPLLLLSGLFDSVDEDADLFEVP